MGIEIGIFVNEVPAYFICAICQDVLENATQPNGCDHAFCRECITQWIDQSTLQNSFPSCPLCRRLITNLIRMGYMDNLVRQRAAYCPNRCRFVAPYDDLNLHLFGCRTLQCPGGCGFESNSFDGHNCVQYLLDRLAQESYSSSSIRYRLRLEQQQHLEDLQTFEAEITYLQHELYSSERRVEGLQILNRYLRISVRVLTRE